MKIVVGQLGLSWAVFEILGNGSARCLTPTLYNTKDQALRAYAAMQEKTP